MNCLKPLHHSTLTIIAVLSVFSISALAQSTINVPADQPTIQVGIDAAQNGDTVLVAPGTYYENINFRGKLITVKSSDGPSVTMIDGSANGSVVTFNTRETTDAVLSGFTIQNGWSTWGAGIEISDSSPIILGNTIKGNQGETGLGMISRVARPRSATTSSQRTAKSVDGTAAGAVFASAPITFQTRRSSLGTRLLTTT